jgi:uncharacterized Zn finger protein
VGYWYYYKPAKPKKVKNGIRLESKIGSTWWSRRWLSVLESFGWSNRLPRGRSYARKGQVVDFKLAPGLVTARVQGTRPKPYSVRIGLRPLSDRDWKKVMSAMASQAVYAAKLLNGEMPEDIEKVFSGVKVPLFPKSPRDLDTDCSCPDWVTPCKHIAAVYYILAEEFDRDPFILFELRGRTKSQIIEGLRELRGRHIPPETRGRGIGEGAPKAKARRGGEAIKAGESVELRDFLQLERCIDDFWKRGEKFKMFFVSIRPPNVPIAVLKRLGEPTFWRGSKHDFYVEFGRIYGIVQEEAMKVAYGGTEG